MVKIIQIFLLMLLMPLFSCSQGKIDRIETTSMFASEADYNELNNHILFVAIDINPVTKSFEGISIKTMDMSNKKEKIIVPNIYLGSPAFGWLDSSHVFYEKKEAIGEERAFGPWQGSLIRHNIFTHQEDAIPSHWHSTDNNADNFLSFDKKLFYTIAYGPFENMDNIYWMEYSIKTKKSKIIGKYKNDDKHPFRILTYQYLPKSEEIIYIKGGKNKREFIRLSISNGAERIIKTINTNNAIESSALNEGRFYYLERETPKNTAGLPDLKNSHFVIKSLDIMKGGIKEVYIFDKGVEVSKISSYGEGKLLVSVQGQVDENVVNKSFDLPSGGDVTIGLDPTSYLYVITPTSPRL